MHRRHGLAIFVKAPHDVALRRDSHGECIPQGRTRMIEIIGRYVDGIDVNAVEVSESVGYGANVVVSNDNALLADSACDCAGTPRYVNAREHPIVQQEPVSSGSTCLSGERVDAG